MNLVLTAPRITTLAEWREYEARQWFLAWRDRGLEVAYLDPDERVALLTHCGGDRLDDFGRLVQRTAEVLGTPQLRDGGTR